MGQGATDISARNLTEATGLTPFSDEQEYKSDVKLWIEYVKDLAIGRDSKAKRVSNGYIYAFYARIDDRYYKIS